MSETTTNRYNELDTAHRDMIDRLINAMASQPDVDHSTPIMEVELTVWNPNNFTLHDSQLFDPFDR